LQRRLEKGIHRSGWRVMTVEGEEYEEMDHVTVLLGGTVGWGVGERKCDEEY
jgi:hypothetical protein